MIGDAYGFVDPMFSTGVLMAMTAGELGAHAADAWLDDPVRGERLALRTNRELARAMDRIGWLIYRINDPVLRSLFMAPRNTLWMRDGLISMLAGNLRGDWRAVLPILSFKTIFHVFSALHRRGLGPGDAGEPARRCLIGPRSWPLTSLPPDAPLEAGMAAARAALRRTAARYRSCARFTRHYVASKLKRDPIHLALLGLAAERPFGHIIDVGCGRGQISVALLEAGLATAATGMDWADAALADLRRAGVGLRIDTIARDLSADIRVPAGDTVLVIDVLYTMERGSALALLNAVAAAARERVLVRSMDASAGWRGRFAVTIERLARPLWPHAGARVDPLPPAALAAALEERGFTTRMAPCWGKTPFANVLMVGKRRMRHPQGAHHRR